MLVSRLIIHNCLIRLPANIPWKVNETVNETSTIQRLMKRKRASWRNLGFASSTVNGNSRLGKETWPPRHPAKTPHPSGSCQAKRQAKRQKSLLRIRSSNPIQNLRLLAARKIAHNLYPSLRMIVYFSSTKVIWISDCNCETLPGASSWITFWILSFDNVVTPSSYWPQKGFSSNQPKEQIGVATGHGYDSVIKGYIKLPFPYQMRISLKKDKGGKSVGGSLNKLKILVCD